VRIRASAGKRKGDIRDAVGHLALTADNDDERDFLTSVYRILTCDGEVQEQGVATMRRFLSSFPVIEEIKR
jgi:hypothetical protein